ncbi:protein of unknown function (plasmid) [Thermococcus nautili]|uniref:hypothetical protein n=1 Tax=Thermococcus nautili TaxID=195522 RepID=UPI00255306E4|nr:hypothetical protein [Thermococcus nautili]CAI1494196.1 protein of unknown function [Thermococcus nautili]
MMHLNKAVKIGKLFHFGLKLKKAEDPLLTIKIYTHYKDEYPLHVQRLKLLFEALNLAEVIEEGWGVDYPRPFMPIKVYQLKILPKVSTMELKLYLKGMEYLGLERLADYDLEVRDRKISWVELAKSMGIKANSKFELAKKSREILWKKLPEGVKSKLEAIEEAILRNRGIEHGAKVEESTPVIC